MNLRDLLANFNQILVLGHHNADPDAVCSMIAFAELYRHINPMGISTLACDDISRLSKQILKVFAPKIQIQESVDVDYPFVVLLDTNSRFQLGANLENILLKPSSTLVIDHHEENPEIENFSAHHIVKSEMSSTCEIVADLFEEYEVPLSPSIASLLMVGILFDTRRYLYASKETFAVAIRLIEAGADYRECVRSLMIRPDRSERIARLKAAGRLQIHNIGEWIIVTSKIGAFEASACRALIDIGADVAIVGGQPSKSTVRISSRSTNHFFNETGVSLGRDVMEQIGTIIGGEGGGHQNAAGANGWKNRDQALERAVELIREKIEVN